jgi:hypothetical protein
MMLLTLLTVFVLRLPKVVMIVKTVQTVLLKMIKAAQVINSQMILILTMMMLGLHLPEAKKCKESVESMTKKFTYSKE